METRDDMDLDIPDEPDTHTKTGIQFKVEIYGDIVCPWCYLGKKSLDTAIDTHATKYPDDVFDIVWKPFILWPTAEVSAYNKGAPILGMVGPLRAPGVFERLAIAGAQYGIQFRWEGLVGNSADANKLVVLAYEIDQKLRQQKEQLEGTPSRNFSSTPPPEPPAATTTTTNPISNYSSPGRTSQLSPPPSPTLSSSASLSTSPGISPSARKNPILNTTQHAFLEALFYETLTQGFDPSDRTFLINLALHMRPPLGASPFELTAYLDSEANVKVGLSPPRPPPLRAPISISNTNKTAPSLTTSSSSLQKHEQQVNASDERERTESEGNKKEKEKQNPYNEKKDLKAIINGVPSVVVQGRYRVGGFQKPEVYLAVFEKVREGSLQELGEATGTATGTPAVL
ncbi:hypothetical protein V8F20_002157 [Naviculisporaceae sp. PSN 640]